MAIDNTNCFATALFAANAGMWGVGGSAWSARFTDQLPPVAELKEDSSKVTVLFEDSREGWSKRGTMNSLMLFGMVMMLITTVKNIRPKGAVLKKSGGRASVLVPEPLKRLLDFTKKILEGHRGRKLSPINCHDIMCMCGEVVVCGGVRRSAEISLSDLG